MVDVWPETLPQCPLRGYQEAMGDGRLISQTDTGPGKMRRRSSTVPDTLTGTFKASGAQLATLRTFVKDTLDEASLPFNYPAPRGGDPLLVRFRDVPSWNEVGPDAFVVGLSLEVLQ